MFRALWFDSRVRAWWLQGLLACGAVGGIVWLVLNARENLMRRGITVGFDFMDQAARFPISESLLAYQTTDTFGHAFVVGIVNTVFISVLVIAVSTVLGFALALARRSTHPLITAIAATYVEVIRNTPLVVQLLFWYGMVTVNLPSARQAYQPLPGVFLSIRGFMFPKLAVAGNSTLFWGVVCAALLFVLAVMLAKPVVRKHWKTRLPMVSIAIAMAAVAITAVLLSGRAVASWELPYLRGLNFTGGMAFTPEFSALLIGLVLYSAAFTGEIIRGGIEAVGRGQWEAGRSLGLRPWHIMRLLILPQALRIIVPPMTSQYLSIIKNTTLALAVGYPDLAFVVATTINQTGQAIEGIVVLMAVFLTISLSVSLFMNAYNRRISLVQR